MILMEILGVTQPDLTWGMSVIPDDVEVDGFEH